MGPILWLTGRSGAGKSTIAHVALPAIRAQRPATILDGDVLRAGISRDLGFSDADRQEHLRRTAEVAVLMAAAGLVVLATTIAPTTADRAIITATIGARHPLRWIHIHAPLAVCQARDPKGLYAAAAAGRIHGLAGVDAPYLPPQTADLEIDTTVTDPTEAARRLLALLR